MATEAIVQSVRDGPHGKFAIATCEGVEGSITFSLDKSVWQESDEPEPGSVVWLSDLRKKRAGWRAMCGRYLRPSDQQRARSNIMEFLYPKSRKFPFDEVCEQIVRALEARNWQVPGLKVDLDEYGSGEAKFRLVRCVRGDDFKIYFCRVQGPAGTEYHHWNDTAAVTEIVIPRKEIHIYEDESGPRFYLYVGDDWARDQKQFIDGSKVHSKLNGKPKMYLQYEGGCNCHQTAGASFKALGFLTAVVTGDKKAIAQMHHTHSGRRPPVLVHTNDLNREYDPEGDEPVVFQTDEVMEEFRKYLEEVVLQMIVSQPVSEVKENAFVEPDVIPFPASIGPLFAFCDWRAAERIKTGRTDPSQLQPSDRYALHSGWRLVSLDTKKIGEVPEIAYDGFLWCGVGEVNADTAFDSLEVPGHWLGSDERFIVRVQPNRANNVYIADHAAYKKRRAEITQTLNGRDRFTDEEVADFTCARGRTIVPLSEYKGGYEQPVVLINRELTFDEVEVISGPHKQ